MWGRGRGGEERLEKQEAGLCLSRWKALPGGRETQLGGGGVRQYPPCATATKYVIPFNSCHDALGCVTIFLSLHGRRSQGSGELNELSDHMAKDGAAPRRRDLNASFLCHFALAPPRWCFPGQVGHMALSCLPSVPSLPPSIFLSLLII